MLAALLPLAWCCVDALVVARLPPPEDVPQLAEAPGADAPPAFTDVSQDGTLAAQAGRAVPPKPERWMKPPPCDAANRDEEAVNGACFVRVPRRPPCKPAQYEHGGACFEAVARAPRRDTSMDDTPR